MSEAGTVNTYGYRPTTVRDLKVLKAPDEGGTKKEYDDFLTAIRRHVEAAWAYGSDISHVMKHKVDPDLGKPGEWDNDNKSRSAEMEWKMMSNLYYGRKSALIENKKALYSLLLGNVSKLARSKVISTYGYADADESKDPLWVIETLDDIISQFDKIRDPILAIAAQCNRTLNHMQSPTDSCEDYITALDREARIYKKHGGDFLWCHVQKKAIASSITDSMPDEVKKETIRVKTKFWEGKTLSRIAISNADKRRFGPLIIELENSHLTM